MNSKHPCLFLTLSTASQDSSGFFLMKSGSVSSRSSATTWVSSTTEEATSNQSNTTPSSLSTESGASSSNENPTPPQRGAGSAPNPCQMKNSTQRQNSDQGLLQPILETPPDSPIVFMMSSSPYKRKLNVQVDLQNLP